MRSCFFLGTDLSRREASDSKDSQAGVKEVEDTEGEDTEGDVRAWQPMVTQLKDGKVRVLQRALHRELSHTTEVSLTQFSVSVQFGRPGELLIRNARTKQECSLAMPFDPALPPRDFLTVDLKERIAYNTDDEVHLIWMPQGLMPSKPTILRDAIDYAGVPLREFRLHDSH